MSVGAIALLGVGAIALIALVVHFAVESARQWKQTLAEIAEAHGLVFSPGSWLSKPSAIGVVGPAHLTVDTITQRSGDSSVTYYRVLATLDLPRIKLAREGMGSFFGKMFKGEDIEVGDVYFDDRVVVRGSEAVVRALLDRETREAVLHAVNEGVSVTDNQIEWRKSGGRDSVPHIVDVVLDLVQRLSRSPDAEALAGVVRNDIPAVAREAFLFMPAGAVRDALDREMLEKGSPELKMIAARRLGGVAAPVVAELAASPRSPDALRADALQWLQRNGDPVATARRCLDRPQVATVALAVLANATPPVALQDLSRLADLGDPTLTQQALRHARRHGKQAEPLLLQHLESEGAQTARVAAEALGEVGTTDAVMPLRNKIESLGLFDGALKSAALGAIEAIQGRVSSEGGALSVVDAEDGRLSEA